MYEGALQSNAPPSVGGALHSAALLSPPNRLRSRDKNREYEKKAELKREARHEFCRDQIVVNFRGSLETISRLSTVLLDIEHMRLRFGVMHRANILLLSSALGLISRGLLCVGEGARSE